MENLSLFILSNYRSTALVKDTIIFISFQESREENLLSPVEGGDIVENVQSDDFSNWKTRSFRNSLKNSNLGVKNEGKPSISR